ncbi:MAG: flippase-like domain-containing protein [Lachnospiraceae bacterium]|nr:flippase-like domain-containing protein [Lachnospiraceae bacterium]
MVKMIAGGAICILWFAVIHAVKLFRMYLVLLEQGIKFRKFIFAYCRTTLANLIIPFKLGEIYRMVVFSRLTKNAGIGIASVIVDRFFDTLALVLILIPLHVLYPARVSAVSVFLTVFVAVTVFVFVIFPSAYEYLNKYIIMHRESRNSMAVLKWLEVLSSGYEYIRKLVRGRYALITLMSFGAWVLEGGLLFVIAGIIGVKYDAGVFSDYITSILSTSHSMLQSKYTLFSIAVMAVCTVVAGFSVLLREKAKNEKDNSRL